MTATLRDSPSAARGLLALHEHQVDEEAHAELGGRVAVSRDGDTIFLYADTQRAAQAAERVLRELLAKHDLDADVRHDRWHHEEDRWEPANVPLPRSRAEHQVEHERLEADDTAESQATGLAAWEVRIEVESHHEAVELERRLRTEGRPAIRRWKYVLVGANDQDDAEALAADLKRESPPGAVIHTEPGGGVAWESLPRSPFAVFGGLGG